MVSSLFIADFGSRRPSPRRSVHCANYPTHATTAWPSPGRHWGLVRRCREYTGSKRRVAPRHPLGACPRISRQPPRVSLRCDGGGALAASILPVAGQEMQHASSKSARVGGLTGTNCFSPGRWGLVGIHAVNPSDQPASLKFTVSLPATRGYSLGEVSVPPRTQRRSWCPVCLPQHVSAGSKVAEIRSVAEDRSGDESLRLTPRGGGLWSEHAVPVERDRPITAILPSGPVFTVDDEAIRRSLPWAPR